ncbi:MAG: peptide-methionine (S)-S-oxide reductase [Parcubacteria group bacterium CG11_big_fil_rev_8_21_14_0_20_39_22]|nr:MAG: peptide-methionine (S)-S-oxide reductase [Parcubacteria group bacterium CG11_big_fil_rev_8_21_14_0_20_39_22]
MIENNIDEKQTVFFGAGCFWGPEAEFRKMNGVVDTEVGFMGGKKVNPSYEQVCSGNTGHIEVVKVIFDSTKISFNDLLQKFWSLHNPTELNRQGVDVGEQYRSAIFYTNKSQESEALISKDYYNKKMYNGNIETEIIPAAEFYPAEEYHQRYLEKSGGGVCGI